MTFAESQVPTCNSTVNGDICNACSLCAGGNGIQLDCSNLLPEMISTCPTQVASHNSTVFKPKDKTLVRGATPRIDLLNPNYHIQIDTWAFFFGGGIEIKFYADPGHEHYLAKFQSYFGGIGIGGFSTSGGGWLNYDVVWLREQGWEANFWLSAAGASVNGIGLGASSIPLWGLSGEEIGAVMSYKGNNAVFAAEMGGKGKFVW